MLPAAPFPVVFSQITSPEVAHFGFALAPRARVGAAALTGTSAARDAAPRRMAVLIERLGDDVIAFMSARLAFRCGEGPAPRASPIVRIAGLYMARASAQRHAIVLSGAGALYGFEPVLTITWEGWRFPPRPSPGRSLARQRFPSIRQSPHVWRTWGGCAPRRLRSSGWSS